MVPYGRESPYAFKRSIQRQIAFLSKAARHIAHCDANYASGSIMPY